MLLSGSEYAGTGEFGLSVGCSGLQKIRSNGSSQDQPMLVMHVAGPPDPAIARDTPLLPITSF